MSALIGSVEARRLWACKVSMAIGTCVKPWILAASAYMLTIGLVPNWGGVCQPVLGITIVALPLPPMAAMIWPSKPAVALVTTSPSFWLPVKSHDSELGDRRAADVHVAVLLALALRSGHGLGSAAAE